VAQAVLLGVTAAASALIGSRLTPKMAVVSTANEATIRRHPLAKINSTPLHSMQFWVQKASPKIKEV
jgi:hypothetical protein